MFFSFTVAPNITEPPTDETAIVTQSVTFTCTAFGVPIPYIDWFLGDTLLESDDVYDISSDSAFAVITSYLTISEVTLDDDGAVFTCSADNVQGNDFAFATLQVLCEFKALLCSTMCCDTLWSVRANSCSN